MSIIPRWLDAESRAGFPARSASELEHFVDRIELVEIMAQHDAAGEVCAGHIVTRATEGEQVSGEIAVRTDPRQAVLRPSIGHVPTVFGQNAGYVWIERRELVHQLTGTLNDDVAALTGGWRRAVRTHDEQPIVIDPAHDVGRTRR